MNSLRFNFINVALMGVLVLFTNSLFGQKYDISGVIKDEADNPLESATVFIQALEDSTVIDYTITKDDGRFEMKGSTNEEKVRFLISYVGFEDFAREISIKDGNFDSLKNIVLKEASSTLDEITLQGSAPPIRIKKDTVEFNVSSFKTKDNANMEDLLKKLPGLTVNRDGTIEFNGKEITKIKVNDKDFFGDDPKVATKNLPKDLLQKIQIVDSKTKEDEFTGRESDSDEKMINVVIKEEDNKGFFSRMTAGAGNDHRFSLNGIANYFKNDLRLSALGSANNINSVGFSFDDVYDAMGRNAYSIMSIGSSGGITKSHLGGLDFVNSWGDKVDLSANYQYDRASTETASDIQRENILPDRHYFNNSSSISKNVGNNHRGGVYLEYTPDTLTRISFRPNISTNNGFSDHNSFAESIDADGKQLNESNSQQHTESNGVNFSNRLDVIRRYGSEGGYFKLGFSNRNNKQKSKNANYTSRDIFDDDGNIINNEIQDQLIDSDRKNDNYTLDAGARIPLGKHWNFDADYTYTTSSDDNDRLLYETDDEEHYDILNEELSSSFKSSTFQHRPRVGVVYRSDKMNAGLSGGLESVRMKNKEEFTDTEFDNTFSNLFARAYMRYRISQTKSLYFNYRNSRNIPSVNQLQPVSNTTNPLNIITGNPDLKPALTNSFSLSFNNYDFRQHQGFFTYIRGSYDNDKIVAKTETDENLVRTTTYDNVDGSYDFSLGARYNKDFTLKDRSTLKPQIGTNASLRKNVGFSNAVKYHSNNFSLSPRASLEYDIPDVIAIEPSYSLTYNRTKYSLGGREDESFTDHVFQTEVTTYWPEDIVFGSTVSYNRLGKTAPGFDRDFVLWNMSLGYKLLGDDGVLKLTAYDLLNQNNSTYRSTGEDYIQDTQELVLKRYFMLSFTYKINKFGGQKSPDNRRGGGRYYRRS